MKKFFLLCSIYISLLNISYGQLTLSSVEFLSNQRELTFINPVTNSSEIRKIGLCIGKIGNPQSGEDVCYYSYDVTPPPSNVSCLPNFDYVDESTATPLPNVVYIVYHYYPAVAGPGQLSNITNEIASIQAAIWYYTNGLDLNTITSNSIKTRALAIVANVNANGGSATVPEVLKILSDVDPDFFYLRTTLDDNTGVAVNNIMLSISQGSISTNSVNTDASGNSPSVEAIETGVGVITATANNIQIPKGILFRHLTNQCPKFILACNGPGTLRTSLDWGALPVELVSFTSSVNGRIITLNWSTASELNNQRFEIEKSSVSGDWTKAGFVNGNGTSSIPNNYSFTENTLNTGRYSYRLKQIDFNGNFEYFNLSSYVVIGVPASFAVSQNYPNPFNPSTKINYDLPVDAKVSVRLFDMSGKEVLNLVNEAQTSGFYTISVNASGLSSGIYFYRVSAEGNGKIFVITKKMMFVK
ncbi:MAG: T9SS type A sorting domain-containing protein [bacterium]